MIVHSTLIAGLLSMATILSVCTVWCARGVLSRWQIGGMISATFVMALPAALALAAIWTESVVLFLLSFVLLWALAGFLALVLYISGLRWAHRAADRNAIKRETP